MACSGVSVIAIRRVDLAQRRHRRSLLYGHHVDAPVGVVMILVAAPVIGDSVFEVNGVIRSLRLICAQCLRLRVIERPVGEGIRESGFGRHDRGDLGKEGRR